MSEPDTEQPDTPQKSPKLPFIIGLLLAVLLGAGGFYATWSGMILGGESDHAVADDVDHDTPDVAFIDVDPMIVSLSSSGPQQHLRFRANLEVPSKYREDVELLLPRVVDVLNSYLRALELHDLEDRAALTRLRAQMLRRVQIVIGPGMVNDLLVMEFVMN